MRFKAKVKPNEGDVRVIKKFLLVPRKLDTDTYRWLEVAYICQGYIKYYDYDSCVYCRWEDVTFTTKEVYDEVKSKELDV